MDPEKLQELADSLAESGMIQPLIVTKKEDSEYELIAGERRLEAAKLAGFTEVPVIIRCVSQQEQLQFALIENIQRENLNPVEEAKAYQQLQDQFDLTHGDISRFVGKERSTVTNSIRLLKLENRVLEMIAEGKLSQGHGRVLLQLTPEEQTEFAAEISRKQLSVRQAENRIRRHLSSAAKKKDDTDDRKRDYWENFGKSLSESYSIPVRINPKAKGGTITFSCKNDEEMQQLLHKLLDN
jgi:ParB family chromosome partitioning protein